MSATYPTGQSRHLTLVANTVATVTLDDDYATVEVVNVDGAAAVYFVVNFAATPTVGGDDTVVLPAAISGVELDPYGAANTTVKLISSGTPNVCVRGW